VSTEKSVCADVVFTQTEIVRALCRFYALGNVPEARQNLRQLATLAELDTNRAISREIAGASEHQIAHPGEARDCQWMATELVRQHANLEQTASNHARARVVTEAEPVDRACRDGNHVLHGTADLDTDDVVRRVDPQFFAGERVLHRLGVLGVGAGDDHGSGHAERDFFGEARPR